MGILYEEQAQEFSAIFLLAVLAIEIYFCYLLAAEKSTAFATPSSEQLENWTSNLTLSHELGSDQVSERANE